MRGLSEYSVCCQALDLNMTYTIPRGMAFWGYEFHYRWPRGRDAVQGIMGTETGLEAETW